MCAERNGFAIDQLTAELQRRVTGLTVHTRDEAGQEFIARTEELLANERPLPPAATFQRSQRLATEQLENELLRSQVIGYFTALQAAGLRDAGVKAATQTQLGTTALLSSFFLTVGFPFFLVGYAFWWLPLFLPGLLAKKLRLYVGYDSNIKTLAGMLTIPLWLWAAYRAVQHWSDNSGLSWLILIGCIALAFFAERYMDVFKRFWAKMQALAFARRHPIKWSDIVATRQGIFDVLLPLL